MISRIPLFDRMIAAWHERPVGVKFLSFAAIGVVNSFVDLGLFSLAHFCFEVPLVLANVLAWSCAVTGSYALNSLTTFARESGRELNFKAYVGFAASQSAGLLANTTAVFIASYYMPILVGKVLAIGASFLVNFSLSHFVVFRKERRPESHKLWLRWMAASALAFLLFAAIGKAVLMQGDANSTATDLSSQSRASPWR